MSPLKLHRRRLIDCYFGFGVRRNVNKTGTVAKHFKGLSFNYCPCNITVFGGTVASTSRYTQLDNAFDDRDDKCVGRGDVSSWPAPSAPRCTLVATLQLFSSLDSLTFSSRK